MIAYSIGSLQRHTIIDPTVNITAKTGASSTSSGAYSPITGNCRIRISAAIDKKKTKPRTIGYTPKCVALTVNGWLSNPKKRGLSRVKTHACDEPNATANFGCSRPPQDAPPTGDTLW